MQRGIYNIDRKFQKPEFSYPKPELPHADFCSVRKPVLSTDAIQTPKRKAGTDGLLTKELLAGASHQAALPPLPSMAQFTFHPTGGRSTCRSKGPYTEQDQFSSWQTVQQKQHKKACCSRALNRTRLIEIHFW